MKTIITIMFVALFCVVSVFAQECIDLNITSWPTPRYAGRTYTVAAEGEGIITWSGAGTFEPTTGNQVNWTAPCVSGRYIVSVQDENSFKSKVTGVSPNDPILVTGGEFHSMFLKPDGTVWSCGFNDWSTGALGDGNETGTRPVPQPVLTGTQHSESGYLENIIHISAGYRHSLAVDSAGYVWAWGWSKLTSHYYGLSPTVDTTVPVKVRGANGQGNLENIIKVSAGRSGEYSLALDVSGNVWAWGVTENDEAQWGQLGNGFFTQDEITPVKVLDGEMNTASGKLENIVDIRAGVSHSIALETNGNVWTWGRNCSGQLGNNDTNGEKKSSPVKVVGGDMETTYLEGIEMVTVASGFVWTYQDRNLYRAQDGSSYALDLNGNVWAWGCNNLGQLGNNSTTDSNTPVLVATGEQQSISGNLENITAISAGNGHVLALCGDGHVWAWGENTTGQLGNGTNTDSNAPVRVKDDNDHDLSNIVYIDAGFAHSMAIDNNGDVWVWGFNLKNQLGIDDDIDRNKAYKLPQSTWCNYF